MRIERTYRFGILEIQFDIRFDAWFIGFGFATKHKRHQIWFIFLCFIVALEVDLSKDKTE